MVSIPARPRFSSLAATGLCALVMVLAGCEGSGQACESDEDCYTGETCVLRTCDLRDDSDTDADIDPDADDTPDTDGDPDAPDSDLEPDVDAPDSDLEPDAEEDTDTEPALPGSIRTLDSLGYDRFHRAVEGPDGDLIALGHSTGTGDDDATLTRIGADGEVLWHKALGTEGGDDDLASLLATSDGDYLAAGVVWRDNRYAPWLVRFEADGTIVWQDSYDVENAEAYWSIRSVFARGLTERSDGSFALGLAGNFYLRDRPNMGMLIVDGAGDVVSASRINMDSEEPVGIAGDSTLTLVGYRRHQFSGTTTLVDAPSVVHIGTNGRIAWQLPVMDDDARIEAIRRTDDGSILLAGWHEGATSEARVPWAMKITSAGNITWQHVFASEESYGFYDIEMAPNGDLLMMASRADAPDDGTYTGASHLVRLNATTGDHIDTHSFGHGESSDLAFYDILALEDESLAMVGSSFRVDQTSNHAAALLRSTSLDDSNSCTLLDASPSFRAATSSMGPSEPNDFPFESVSSLLATRADFDAFRVVDLATTNDHFCPL